MKEFVFSIGDKVETLGGRIGVVMSRKVRGAWLVFVDGGSWSGWINQDLLRLADQECDVVENDAVEQNECSKRAFKSERDASAAIFKWKRHSGRSRIPVRYYFCKECRMYHLTSKK